VAEVLGGGDFDAADLGEVGFVGPAEEAGEAVGFVLKFAGAVEVFDALFDGFIEADDHGGGGLEAGGDDGPLGLEVFGYGVFELAVAAAEVFGEDLGAAAGDPANARLLELLGCGGVVEFGVVGEVHELGDGEGVELEGVAVAGADGGEEVAVVGQREMRVEAAVEGGEVAAEGEEFVELGEDLLLREDVAAGLAGEFVEGAVVALGDADVGVVDDAHDHVGAGGGGVEAGSDLGGEGAEFGVGGVLPEVEGVGGGDALTGDDLVVNFLRDGGEGLHWN